MINKNISKSYLLSAALIVVYLFLMDIGINSIFKYPVNPAIDLPSSLQQYFEYGRSVEGKFARKVKKVIGDSAEKFTGGWLVSSEQLYSEFNLPINSQQDLVTLYGMSGYYQY